jgi:polysaccharide export outer membrane protein
VTGALAAQAEQTIAPRDELTVTVFGEPTMSGKFTVDPDGTFEFPLVGRVKAAGLTARGAEAELNRRLSDGYLKNPQITVLIGQIANQRVFVLGEVRAPGTYQFPGGVTLIEAISRAGSTIPTAARQVLIIRPVDARNPAPSMPDESGTEVLRIDLRDLQSGELLKNNIVLRDGDTVFVPRAQMVYLTGQVRSPGAYSIEPGTSVLQALSLAGGATDRGATSRIKIIRNEDDKKRELKAKLTDVVEPGDTIVVPERYF